MALAKCKACGKELDPRAGKCQHCGAKVGPKPWALPLALGLVVILVVVLYGVNHPDPAPPPPHSALVDAPAPAIDAPPVRPHWRYNDDPDPMSGGKYRLATVDSANEVIFDSPYGGAQRATLTLQRSPDSRTSVIFTIERGQLLCVNEDCPISVRFGTGVAQWFHQHEPADHKTTVRFIENYARFVSQLRKVDVVRIQPTVYENGSPTFEFDVSGLNWK